MKTLIHTSVLAALASAESPKGGKTGAAVQNTLPDTSLNGKTLGEVVKDLDKSDLRQAYKAMDAAYDIQFGKDGIEDTQAKLNGLQGKVGEQVYAIAKIAMAHCEGRLVIVRSYFLALCSQSETYKENWYTSKYKEEKPIGQLIPLWSTYKSRIAKGLEKGISPDEVIPDTDAPKYATAAQYSAAVVAMEKEARATGSQAGSERKTDGQVATGLSAISSGWSPNLRAAMETMCKAFNVLTHEEQDKFAPQILDIAHEAMVYKAEAAKAARAPEGQLVTDESGKVTGTSSSDEEELDPGTKAALQAALDRDDTSAAEDRATQNKDEAAARVEAAKGKRKGARAA